MVDSKLEKTAQPEGENIPLVPADQESPAQVGDLPANPRQADFAPENRGEAHGALAATDTNMGDMGNFENIDNVEETSPAQANAAAAAGPHGDLAANDWDAHEVASLAAALDLSRDDEAQDEAAVDQSNSSAEGDHEFAGEDWLSLVDQELGAADSELENLVDNEIDLATAFASEAEANSAADSEEDVGELAAYESAEIEDQEFVEAERVQSIIESLLFATDKPQSLASLKQAFKGTSVSTRHIRRALDALAVEYAGATRGVTLEEVSGGFQLRTKVDNVDYLKRLVKARTFRLSGPALEVLAIAAYKQPLTKAEVDEIRGVESGHLMRGLMDRGLICFNGKSDLPGKPMLYATTKKFLEIFGLRNLKELPSLSEIDELIPEGIGDELSEKETLSDVTASMSKEILAGSYSEGEQELEKINTQLAQIETSSQFFEDEKRREREQKDRDRAQDIRERLTVGEEVDVRDVRWLERYEERLAAERAQLAEEAAAVAEPEANSQDLVGEAAGAHADDFVASLVNEEGLDAFALAEIEAAVRAYEEERGVIPVDEVAEAKEFAELRVKEEEAK